MDSSSDSTSQLPYRPSLFSGTVEFIATFSSVIMGLGNYWRFPFLAYEYDGGSFVVAYYLLYVMLGKPMMLLELTLGQFSRKGNISTFYRFGPAYTGIGVSQLCANLCALSYYAVITSIALFYCSQSFHDTLPWTLCDSHWESEYGCVPSDNLSAYYKVIKNKSIISRDNSSRNAIQTSEQIYLSEVVFTENLEIIKGIGPPNWGLAVSLFVVWGFAFITMRLGITGMGFFNYFFALVPWVMTILMIGKAITLPGALAGIKYLFKIKWAHLAEAKLWLAASAQVMFSLGIGFGTTSMYSSYCSSHTNIKTVSTVICVLDGILTMLISCVVFGTVGNIAYEFQLEFNDVIISGRGAFVFLVYSYLLSKFYLPTVASAFFFFVLTLNGIESLVSFCQMLISQYFDTIPNCITHTQLTLLISLVSFFVGLPYLTPQGQLFIRTIDFFGVTLLLCVIGMTECMITVYGYGMRRFCWDIEYICGERPDMCSVMGWRIPGMIMVLDIIVFVLGVRDIRHGEQVMNELLVDAGWILAITSLIPIPGLAICTIILNSKKGCRGMFRSAISEHRWVPGDPDDVANYREFIRNKKRSLARRKYKSKFHKWWDMFIGY